MSLTVQLLPIKEEGLATPQAALRPRFPHPKTDFEQVLRLCAHRSAALLCPSRARCARCARCARSALP